MESRFVICESDKTLSGVLCNKADADVTFVSGWQWSADTTGCTYSEESWVWAGWKSNKGSFLWELLLFQRTSYEQFKAVELPKRCREDVTWLSTIKLTTAVIHRYWKLWLDYPIHNNGAIHTHTHTYTCMLIDPSSRKASPKMKRSIHRSLCVCRCVIPLSNSTWYSLEAPVTVLSRPQRWANSSTSWICVVSRYESWPTHVTQCTISFIWCISSFNVDFVLCTL